MRILGHRHTGVIVLDLDRMLEFYVGLGLSVRRRDYETGSFIDGLLGTTNVELETAKLMLDDPSIEFRYRFQLELMRVVGSSGAVPKEPTHLEQFDFLSKPSGVLDIAFTVDDIRKVLEFIVANGGKAIGEPLAASAGFPALHCYALDPEGNVLHLAENLAPTTEGTV